MLTHELNINKAPKEQVKSNLEKFFSGAKMKPVRKVLKKGNNYVLSLMIFYENIKNMIFKALIPIVYYIMDNYVCVDYLCCT